MALISFSFAYCSWISKILVPICLYCFCTTFGQLLLRKIIKIIATRCKILRLKCTKFDFDLGSVPDPAGPLGSLPHSPDPLAGFKGATSMTGRRRGREEGEDRNRREGGGKADRGQREWEGRERTLDGEGRERRKGRERGRGAIAPNFNSCCRHCMYHAFGQF